MLIVTRHRVPAESMAQVQAAITMLVELLQDAAGFQSLEVGRSPDEPDLFVLVSRWDDAGSARRGLTSSDVRMLCWALFATAIDEPTSFESVVSATPTHLVRGQSVLAADVAQVRLGEAAAPDVESAGW